MAKPTVEVLPFAFKSGTELSGFAVVYERSQAPADPGVLARVMDRLAHRGPDGSDVFVTGHAALGHYHFWTTPEEVGERQPLRLPGMPFRIVFDGRLDNRPELANRLGLDAEQENYISDAALVLHAYALWGEHCFEHFIGEFGLVILDEQKDRLVCARDQLGDRTLFYASRGDRLVVASEPWAVAGADGLKPEISERAVAHYFALRAPEDGQTFFEGVFELLPAHVMIVDSSGERKWRYWRPDPIQKIRYKTDEEYAEHFRTLLEESVRCRMRSTTPVGVLMSGGLDSTSVASLAARLIAPQQLTTISYVFDEFPECDERVYINAVKEKYNLRSIQIPSDDLWPLRRWSEWPQTPNYPRADAYRPIRERAHHHACQEGLRVLLTGDFGDHLYSNSDNWLVDLLIDRRWNDAWREMTHHLGENGLRRTLVAGYMRRVAKHAFNRISGGRHFHRKRKAPSWLTPLAASNILEREMASESGGMLGLWTSLGSSMGIFNIHHPALELRYPYRDRRLVEFMLAVPAHQLYSQGRFRSILRRSMQHVLPEIVRLRPGKTSLITLLFHGISVEKETIASEILNSSAPWRKFVRPDWIMERWDAVFSSELDGPEKVVPWLCISCNAWCKNIQTCFGGVYVE